MIYRYYAERGGWRFVVMFHKGYKHVRLLDTATFDIYRITPRDIGQLRAVPDVKAKILARRIRERRRLFKRCEVGFPEKTVKKALTVLGGA